MFEFYTKFEFNSKFELYTKFELCSLSFYHFLIILSFLISWLFKCLQLLSGEWREYFSSRRHRFVSTQWLPLRRHDSSSEQKRRICNRWWHESSEFDTSNFDASHHSLHGQHLTLVLCLLPPGTRRFHVGEGLYNPVFVTTADVDLLQWRAAFDWTSIVFCGTTNFNIYYFCFFFNILRNEFLLILYFVELYV